MKNSPSHKNSGMPFDDHEYTLDIIKRLSTVLVLHSMVFFRYAFLKPDGYLSPRGNWNRGRLIMPFSDSYSAMAFIERSKGRLSCLVTIDNIDRAVWEAQGYVTPGIDAMVYAAELYLPFKRWSLGDLEPHSRGVLYGGDPKLIVGALLKAATERGIFG